MSPVVLAALFAGVVALVVLGVGAAVFAGRRSADQALARRLRRVAAPLANPAGARAQAEEAQSIFRTRARRAHLGWVWRPLARRYPLVHAPKALALAAGLGAAAAAFAGFAMWFLKVPGGWWTVPILWAAGAFGGWQALKSQQAKREAAFIRQFPEIVDQIVRLAGAGVPSIEALSVVTEDAPEPIKPVLQEVCDALQAGLDADRALHLTTKRVRLAEFTLFAAVLRLQRRSGGGVSGAFANLSEALRERGKSALKARASTAQTRFTLLVLTVMPMLVLIAQKFIAPASVEMLFSTEQGTMLLRVGTGLIVTGLLVAHALAARVAR